MINYDEIIKLLSSGECYEVRNKISKLIKNEDFIDKIVTIDNPITFDRFMKLAEYKTDTSKIYEKRNSFIKRVLLNINNKTNISEKWVTEYIVGYFFQDNFYNFMTNFFQMVNYLDHTKKLLVNYDHIKIYNKFRNLNHMSLNEKILLFKEYYLDNNLMELFYDDMNIVREESHRELVNSSLKLSHDLPIYKKDISNKFNIDIYYLNGEEFYGFVRCFIIERNDLTNHNKYIYSKKNRLGYSFSYISNNNIGTSDYDEKSVALFYDKIDYRNIMYVHHADLHAKKMRVQDDYLSDKENEIITPDNLIAHTKNYNEIYIKGDKKGIKPSALICYDEITNDDMLFAKKYRLAILLINRKKYKRYETFDDDYMENTYVM